MKTARMFSWARLTLTLLIALVCTSVAWAADPVSYIDENGETQTITEYKVMDEYTSTYNKGGWFVLKNDVYCNNDIVVRGDVHIVLLDGKTFHLGKKENPVNLGDAAFQVNGNLTIYGQEGQTGKFSVYTNYTKNSYPEIIKRGLFIVSDFTINGGSVIVENTGLSNYVYGIYAKNLIVNRGAVSVNSENIADNSWNHAIDATQNIFINGGDVSVSSIAFNSIGLRASKNVVINGGTVSAASNGDFIDYGIVSANIALGYSNESDRITANRYYADNPVTTKEGQAFKDEDGNILIGPAYNEQMAVFAGKTLEPCNAIGFVTGSKYATIVPAQEIEIGQTPTKPADPVRAGFNFLGWYADADLTTPFDFTTPLTQSTVAYAKWSTSYIDENGNTQVIEDLTKLTGYESELTSGWYLVDDNITYSNSLQISDDVNIILADGVTMNVTCYANYNEICAHSPLYGENGNLTIYGQSNQTGAIRTNTTNGIKVAKNNSFDVANITVNGGAVTAISASTGAYNGIKAQNLTLNRGTITASSEGTYGIKTQNLTINGGVLTIPETSGGIDVSSVVINDGSVSITAKGDYGIKTQDLNVNGGKIKATASGGLLNLPHYGIYVNGGVFNLGYTNTSDFISASSYYVNTGSFIIKEGQSFKDEDGNEYSGTLTSGQTSAIAGKTLKPVLSPVNYIDENGYTKTIDFYTVLDGNETELTDGWYVVDSDIYYNNTLNISGDVRIVVCDGKAMHAGTDASPLNETAIKGTAQSKLTIYGQKAGSGFFIAHSNDPDNAIIANDLVINGICVFFYASGVNDVRAEHLIVNSGQVYIESEGNCGVDAENVTANGGYLLVKAKGEYAIKAGSVNVNGGQIYIPAKDNDDAEQYYGIYTNSGDISLGYTYWNDYIRVCRYYAENGSVVVKDGLKLKDGEGNYFSGTLSSEQIAAIADKKLYPSRTFSYIDENGEEQTIDGYIDLTERETHLREGWYVAQGEITFSEKISVTQDVRIILADGATVNVGTSENPIDDYHAIRGLLGTLTIYGQKEQTGKFNIYSSCDDHYAMLMTRGGVAVYGGNLSATVLGQDGHGIYADNFTITNGSVSVKTMGVSGIYSTGDFTVNGGLLTVSDDKSGGLSSSGLFVVNGGSISLTGKKSSVSSSENIIVNGGSVVTSGINGTREVIVNGGVVSSTSNSYGIKGRSITINDGSVTSKGNHAFFAGNMTVNGGVVSAEATGTSNTYGIQAERQLTINGGVVSVTSPECKRCFGIDALFAKITLGYTDESDYIFASNYMLEVPELGAELVVKDGQVLTDGEGNYYTGTLTEEQVAAIAGKTLRPAIHPLLVMTDADGRKRANIDGAYNGSDIVDIPEDIDVDTVDVTRSFTTGVYSTFVFPFDVNTSNIEGLQKVLRFNGLKQRDDKSWVVRMKRLWTDTSSTHVDLSANTPYLILMKDQNLVVHGGVTLRKTEEPVATIDGCDWEFRGTLAYKKWEEGDPELGRVYGFAGQAKDGIKIGQFVKAAAGAYIYPFRAYLIKKAPASAVKSNYAGAKSMTSMSLPSEIDIVVDEDENGEQTTTIGRFNTRTGEFKMLPEYDLKGRKLNGRPKARGAYYGNKVIKK